MKIICFHLFNDFSGSPKVLHDVLQGLIADGAEIELITTRGGVLDKLDIPARNRKSYSYSFSPNPVLTMLRYISAQIVTFAIALRYAFHRNTVFYINTILPLGPALAGRLTGKRIVYHYHENAFVKGSFYRLLAWAMEHLADKIICVSAYQASFLKRKYNVEIISNALSQPFLSSLHPNPSESFARQNVLMLSSLKAYKGTATFIRLAESLPQFNFTLVINDTTEAIDEWLENEHLSVTGNLTIHPRSSNVAPFYNSASLVLNLSDPDLIIETFGLTALEAMSCALPVIVPPAGGIAEMVTDGVNGFKINCKDITALKDTITDILTNREIYQTLADNALSRSKAYSPKSMIKNIKHTLTEF